MTEATHRRYRVVYRDGEHATAIGILTDVPAHFRALDPVLSRLLQRGVDHGELVLIDADTGETVARRVVRQPRSRAGSSDRT